ncbi:MAG: hypothetical protein V1709_08945 [Planctomycetota bacterium]
MNKPPLLYYRSIEQIKEYRAIPVEDRLRWLEEGSRFFGRLYYALPKNRQDSIKEFRRIKTKSGVK